ncbi:MAG: DUF1127 domain-containing protein [Dongiaceae bacterium]
MNERAYPGARQNEGFVAAVAGVFWRALDAALERGRQRRALALLDRRLLDDIGLSADDVRAECDRPFWR